MRSLEENAFSEHNTSFEYEFPCWGEYAIELRVLGRYSPYPPAKGACVSYLVCRGDTLILTECGSGAVSRLQEVADWRNLTCVILSHLHADHMSDMLVLRYAVHIDMRNGLRKQPLRVYCPQEPVAQRELLDYKGALEVVPVSAGERLSLGDIDVEFCPAVHPIPCLSMKFSTGKSTLVYSGDTEPNSDLESLARDADTLLCEATCTSTYSAPGHFLCEELGRFAKRARVGRLIATHFATGEDVAQAMREIRLHYPDAEEAQERRVYKISRKPDS